MSGFLAGSIQGLERTLPIRACETARKQLRMSLAFLEVFLVFAAVSSSDGSVGQVTALVDPSTRALWDSIERTLTRRLAKEKGYVFNQTFVV